MRLSMTIAALAASMIAATAAHAEPLPREIRGADQKLVKYATLTGQKGTDGKTYDFKIQYGHGTSGKGKTAVMTAFTRVLMKPANGKSYKKPSASRLSELFPGSIAYVSVDASTTAENGRFTCGKRRWYKSKEYTTYVYMNKTICPGKGKNSGHRAKIGGITVVDGKLK